MDGGGGELKMIKTEELNLDTKAKVNDGEGGGEETQCSLIR